MFSKENKEDIPITETVRGALFYKGKFLILQKENSSKNPSAFEFPGGKIDAIDGGTSSPEEQEKALRREIQEETGINISTFPVKKVHDYKIFFLATGKDNQKRKYRRHVHLFLIHIPDTAEISVAVNETRNATGESEDNHATHQWVSPEELVTLATSLEENQTTKQKNHPLSRNSRAIKKLLSALN